MIWARRTLPMLLGAGLVYLGYRLAAANAPLVEVDFLAGRVEGVALWKALLGAFAIGAGSVGAFALLQMARTALLTRRYRKKLLDLEVEVHQLRNLPLVPEEAARAEGPVGVLGGVEASGS
jgi:hypothetical protein